MGGAAKYRQHARALGEAIAGRGLGLVYGGGNVGLMGAVADAALAGGSTVVGVIPRSLRDRELAHNGLHELIVVDDMHGRKAIMAENADLFIAMPGGYGTLEELFETVAWSQLGIHDKPIGLLNTDGYFDGLIAFLDHGVRERFLDPRHRALLRVDAQPAKLLNALLARVGGES